MASNITNITVGKGGSVGHSYDIGLILVSYLVSICGCWTTLELLQRRTGAGGYYNWYILVAAACSMGSVAIWSMHFIGNRSIIMDMGQDEAQIQYNPGYTAGSFFAPTVVIGMAFYFFSIKEEVGLISTIIGGVLTGVAVCGMHYMGQGGIANYDPTYLWPYVLGSAVIAVFATTACISLFFYLRAEWHGFWWKRCACACVLAAAVSAMHWVATVGTIYHLKPDYRMETAPGLSRRATVVVTMTLGVVCCFSLVTFAFLGQHARQLAADRAQQVVLAVVAFDHEGKLMVTRDGLLPCRKITDSYIERSFSDVFDISHPVFCWIYRATRCWLSVADVLPGIRHHVRQSVPKKSYSLFAPLNGSRRKGSNNGESTEAYSELFKELFCIAAKSLADAIGEPLHLLGVLSGTIMGTGTLSRSAKLKIRGFNMENCVFSTAERGETSRIIGRGQLLFVLRQVNRVDGFRFQSNGFRFASLSNIIEPLARSIEVTQGDLLPRLESMRTSVLEDCLLEPGIYLASFALRPVFHKAFNVVVRKEANHLLPMRLLQTSALLPWQMTIIRRMNNLTVASCLDILIENRMIVGEEESKFAAELLQDIEDLAQIIGSSYFYEARLVATPLPAPCTPFKVNGQLRYAYLLTFRTVLDIHQVETMNSRHELIPLRFFNCMQHSYIDGPDNDVFARKIHREFAGLQQLAETQPRSPSMNTPQPYDRRTSAEVSRFGNGEITCTGPFGAARARGGGLKNALLRFKRRGEASYAHEIQQNLVNLGIVHPHGGIRVTNDVDVIQSPAPKDGNTVEMTNLPPASDAQASADKDSQTFAEFLLDIIKADREKKGQRMSRQ